MLLQNRDGIKGVHAMIYTEDAIGLFDNSEGVTLQVVPKQECN